ncbi:hypothetical protein ABXS75_15915 [Roseburia hominis]
MTQEEYEEQQREIEQLINQINALIAENNMLAQEIENALHNIQVLKSNISVLHRDVEPAMHVLSGEMGMNADKAKMVSDALNELTEQYFTFKTLSSASKNLSQYTEEYYTRFSYYHMLRRITLGYVIGLDSNFVSSENMRKTVEKAYLQNTEYWLAYAASAIMLWASDEKEAAKRALDKALFMNQGKAALFFMLVNLRFDRTQPAQEWFVYYMERIDASNLGEEWKYLLQAYLSGAFGEEEVFQAAVAEKLKTMLARAEATTVDLGRKFSDRAYRFEETYLHQTTQAFAHLKQCCTSYQEMTELLSDAEKNEVIAAFYDKLSQETEEIGKDISQRIENVLYSLVGSYDDAEFEVVKKMRYNEAVLSAQGNVTKAQEKYDQEFGEAGKKNFGDLLVDWAFAEDSNLTPLMIRKFSISFMKDWILKGYQKYAEDYRKKEKQAYAFQIDEECQIVCTEHDFEKGKKQVEEYYERNKWKHILSDKFTLLYLLLIACGIITLVIMAFQFSKVALTIGILLVIVGTFLIWRRIVELGDAIKEKKRLGVQKLRHCLTELSQWRELFHQADDKMADLEAALRGFDREFE